jgi:hypothetical protein
MAILSETAAAKAASLRISSYRNAEALRDLKSLTTPKIHPPKIHALKTLSGAREFIRLSENRPPRTENCSSVPEANANRARCAYHIASRVD